MRGERSFNSTSTRSRLMFAHSFFSPLPPPPSLLPSRPPTSPINPETSPSPLLRDVGSFKTASTPSEARSQVQLPLPFPKGCERLGLDDGGTGKREPPPPPQPNAGKLDHPMTAGWTQCPQINKGEGRSDADEGRNREKEEGMRKRRRQERGGEAQERGGAAQERGGAGWKRRQRGARKW